MKAIILAAGYGTRLYPLTLDKPKAFIEVNGKPILDYVLERINEIPEIDKISVVTNNKFYDLFDKWKQRAKTKKQIIIVNDNTNNNEERLGALGDLMFTIDKQKIDEDFLLLASDNLFDASLTGMTELRTAHDLVCVVEVNSLEQRQKLGIVETDADRKIIGFQEKPQEPRTNLVSTGIYLFRRETIPLIRKYKEEGYSMDGPGKLLEWLISQKPVYAYPLPGKWFDIGSMSALEEAEKAFSEKE